MKYSEYNRLQEFLDNNDMGFDEFRNTPINDLNEIFGLNKLLFSLGSKFFKNIKIKNIAEKLRSDVEAQIEDNSAKLISAKKKSISRAESTEEGKRDIRSIENKMIKAINDNIDHMIELQSDRVNMVINRSTRLNERHKIALRYLWNKLSTDIKLDAFAELMSRKVFKNPSVIGGIETAVINKKKEMKKREQQVIKDIKNSDEKKKTADTPAGEKIKQTL